MIKADIYGLLRAGSLLILTVQGMGCAHKGTGTSGSGNGSTGGGTSDTSLIGNWEFHATSSGTLPFTSLSGFLNEQQVVGDSTFTTASLQVQSDSCFAATRVIDFDGFTKVPLAQLTSFISDSQTITLGLSQQCTGVSLCGTYTIAGGCADRATGSIVGTKYSRLGGVFKTAPASPVGAQMTLSQSDQGSGQGNIQVSGSMTFTGLQCGTSAEVDPTQSAVSGSSLHLVSTFGDAGNSPFTIDATINAAASTLTIIKVTFSGSTCFVPLNGASLSNV